MYMCVLCGTTCWRVLSTALQGGLLAQMAILSHMTGPAVLLLSSTLPRFACANSLSMLRACMLGVGVAGMDESGASVTMQKSMLFDACTGTFLSRGLACCNAQEERYLPAC